jgi:Prp8 binding protein
MSEKRKDNSVGGALIKRAKQDEQDNDKALINLSNQRSGTKNAIVGTVKNAYIYID